MILKVACLVSVCVNVDCAVVQKLKASTLQVADGSKADASLNKPKGIYFEGVSITDLMLMYSVRWPCAEAQ